MASTSASFGRLVRLAFFLLFTFSAAQSCYYPDGTLSTNEVPCGTGAASCCGADALCMDNGLCFYGGIVSRASCTDKTWNSPACPAYCKKTSPSTSIPISPCSNSTRTFACGLTGTSCSDPSNTFVMSGGDSIHLSPSQVAQLLGSAVTQASPAATSASAGTYTLGALIGVGVGMGIPLIIASGIAIFLFRQSKTRQPKVVYPLPTADNKSEFSFRPPPPLSPPFGSRMSMGSNHSEPVSMMSVTTVGPQTPVHMQPFAERYSPGSKQKAFRTDTTEIPMPVSPIRNGSVEQVTALPAARGQVRQVTVAR